MRRGPRSGYDTDLDLKQAKRTAGSCGVAPEALVAWISPFSENKGDRTSHLDQTAAEMQGDELHNSQNPSEAGKPSQELETRYLRFCQ